MEREDPIWQTRSTTPMSIPSSSEAVATHTLTSPCFSFSSAASLVVRERLPWVGHHSLIPKPLGQLVGDALHHPAGVDEDQGRAVGTHQVGDVVQGLGPLLVGGNWAKLPGRQLYRQVQVASVARVHNQAVGSAVLGEVVVAHQEAGHLLNGLLCGRQSNTGNGSLSQRAQSLHGQGEVRAALVVGDGVYLVQYQCPGSRQSSAPALRCQQDVQRLRGCYQDVGRLLCHALSLGGLGVSGADGSAYIRQEAPRLLGPEPVSPPEARPGSFECRWRGPLTETRTPPGWCPGRLPSMPARTSPSMHVRKAASVLPDPVGAAMRV